MIDSAMDKIRARPNVSAIVISYYTGPLLARSVASLQAQPDIKQIIIVDNGNIPGEVDRTAAENAGSAEIVVLSGHGNIGFAAACNLGAKRASGAHLLFLNPDAIMPIGGVKQLLDGGERLDRPWLIGAKLVSPDGVEQQGSRRAALTPWRAFVEAGRLYNLAPRHPYFRRFNLHQEDCPDKITQVPTISGACFFLPTEDYFAIDGMDERYFLHVEDVDFCLRFSKAGGEIYFDPNVSIIHYKSSSRANPVKIEARKTSGIIRYFNEHFSDAYPRPFLWVVAGLLWISFGVLFLRRGVGKILRLAGLRARAGSRGLERARSFSARRSSR